MDLPINFVVKAPPGRDPIVRFCWNERGDQKGWHINDGISSSGYALDLRDAVANYNQRMMSREEPVKNLPVTELDGWRDATTDFFIYLTRFPLPVVPEPQDILISKETARAYLDSIGNDSPLPINGGRVVINRNAKTVYSYKHFGAYEGQLRLEIFNQDNFEWEIAKL